MAAEMPHVTRVPLYVDGRPRITARAVALFRQIRRLRCASGHWHDDCEACRQWSNLHGDLNDELGCLPWNWPCLSRIYEQGSAAQQELWTMLSRAARGAAAAKVEGKAKARAQARGRPAPAPGPIDGPRLIEDEDLRH
jgi:hypothetical protein